MRLFYRLAIFFLALILSPFLFADQALVKRPNVQHFIQLMMHEHGFSKSELEKIISQATLQPQIIESMEKPYEKKTWDVYKQIFLTEQRLEEGLKFWKENQQALEKAEKIYKVPAAIIVSILGVETMYGRKQGTYRVLDALATLAFNYPKRSPYFTKELTEFLLLCREHHVPATQYLGSYAGAMGMPQFMPSSYRYYAVNFSGKPKKDLMNSNEDVIASIANYIHKHGWNFEQGIAQPAKIVGSNYKNISTELKSAAYTGEQLKHAGVLPKTASKLSPAKVGLIALSTKAGSEYWLAYPNFYVITRYNTSPQYALAVYLLSQQLSNQWIALKKRPYAYG